MMHASAYGRLSQDPKQISTQSGKAMAVGSIAVAIGDHDDPPLWMGVVTFGRVAKDFLKCRKGDMVSVSGRVQRNSWISGSGEKHEQLQVVADSVVSNRTVRPGGGRKSNSVNTSSGTGHDRVDSDMDDPLPF
ncbi:single-stranded DNA-binding protein [Rhizobium sp. KVB221]|uniref:Single-stranded DNA-binding protein n=1 Tax=Rhizobium setariae TaxID=2801340 RepID=A0A937CM86_9HYPH|nr:single-stranded DNA-binding protein [Rhizobium setariae]MBL0374015.1 single-stranded DNA-binding protein [Rhizobium setariae]